MTARSHRALSVTDARTMLLVLACLLAAAAAAPSYDQRQDGEFNAQVDVQNIIFVVGLPKKLPVGDLLSVLLKNSKRSGDESIAQDRADVSNTLEAFVEPNQPYKVIIGAEGERIVEAEPGNAIVIAGRRHDVEVNDEMKLIGATEQCGPDKRRDPVTLTCKSIHDLRIAKPENDITPEVVPVPT